MSVYRDTNASVVFEHPHPGPLTATVYRNDETTAVHTQSGIATVAGTFTVALPWQVMQYDSTLTIVWSDGAGFSREQTVDVVTPLVSLSRLRTLFEGESKTDAELRELEQAVRVFIQTYTGQSYGFFTGVRTFVGTGQNKVLLPQRLNKLTAFAGVYGGNPDPTKNIDLVSVGSDGWSLIVNQKKYLGIKEAPPEELLNVYSGGIIRVPDWYLKRFDSGQTYTVTGEWGYDAVPDAVQEAAMLLANDYSCNETLYRDRYLESIKIQQDTIIYHPGAFRGTGNARADLLLAKYRRQGPVVI